MGCDSPEEPYPIGKDVYNRTCRYCHNTLFGYTPGIGDVAAWESRIQQGLPTLINHAISGYGRMPAKGGNTQFTEQEIEEAVKFMVSKVATINGNELVIKETEE